MGIGRAYLRVYSMQPELRDGLLWRQEVFVIRFPAQSENCRLQGRVLKAEQSYTYHNRMSDKIWLAC